MFGGTSGLDAAVAYAEENGGGTVAVASQSSAARAILAGTVTSSRSAGSPAARAR